MGRTIVLTSSNAVSVNGYWNHLTYSFPSGQVTFTKDNKIALSSASIYYSWPNITSSNGGLSYTWTDGTVVSCTLPSGFYTISDINAYLQSKMYANKHYLLDSSSDPVYYLELLENTVYYSAQINSYAVPTALPTGYTLPSGASWSLPATAKTPQLTIGTISTILGFTAASYPSSTQTTDYSVYSTTTPQLTPVMSCLMTCSLVRNDLSTPTNLLYSFSPDVGYGSLIQKAPSTPVYNDIQAGTYESLSLDLYDQDFSRLSVQDKAMVLLLEII